MASCKFWVASQKAPGHVQYLCKGRRGEVSNYLYSDYYSDNYCYCDHIPQLPSRTRPPLPTPPPTLASLGRWGTGWCGCVFDLCYSSVCTCTSCFVFLVPITADASRFRRDVSVWRADEVVAATKRVGGACRLRVLLQEDVCVRV